MHLEGVPTFENHRYSQRLWCPVGEVKALPGRVDAWVNISESICIFCSEAGIQDVGKERECSRVSPSEASDLWFK